MLFVGNGILRVVASKSLPTVITMVCVSLPIDKDGERAQIRERCAMDAVLCGGVWGGSVIIIVCLVRAIEFSKGRASARQHRKLRGQTLVAPMLCDVNLATDLTPFQNSQRFCPELPFGIFDFSYYLSQIRRKKNKKRLLGAIPSRAGFVSWCQEKTTEESSIYHHPLCHK